MKKLFCLLFILMVTFVACNDEVGVEPISNEDAELATFVDAKTAIDIAHSFMDKQDARVNKRAKERVSEVKEIKSKNGKTAIYVVNNTEGGWQLVSADTRMPVLVLGWNDTDEFSDFADANNGVKMVVGEFVGRISELQGIEPTEQEIESALGGIHAGLIPVPDHMLPSFPGEPGGCDPGSVEYYYSPVTAEDLS